MTSCPSQSSHDSIEIYIEERTLRPRVMMRPYNRVSCAFVLLLVCLIQLSLVQLCLGTKEVEGGSNCRWSDRLFECRLFRAIYRNSISHTSDHGPPMYLKHVKRCSLTRYESKLRAVALNQTETTLTGESLCTECVYTTINLSLEGRVDFHVIYKTEISTYSGLQFFSHLIFIPVGISDSLIIDRY